MATITAYVDGGGDLITLDTAERIRRATPGERAESFAEGGGTGAIRATVSDRTLARRCPRFVEQQRRYNACPQ